MIPQTIFFSTEEVVYKENETKSEKNTILMEISSTFKIRS